MKSKKIVLEFPIQTSKHTLFEYISKPDRLREWFAQEVHVDKDEKRFTFVWEDESRETEVRYFRENKYVRYNWLDGDGYLEFRISEDEITGEITFIVTDFVEADETEEEMRLIWDTQIAILHEIIG